RVSRRSTAWNCCIISGSSALQSGCAGLCASSIAEHATAESAGSAENSFTSLRPRDRRDDFPVEADEAVQLALEQPLLIAVRAEALRRVLEAGRRADAEALDAPRAKLRHVGRARAHHGQRRRVVDLRAGGLERLERLGVELRVGAGGALVLAGEAHL